MNSTEKQSQRIRPYGPGKFNTILDSYVYSVSLDGGCDDEVGESETTGWYGLMRHGRTIFRDHDPFLESLNETEQKQLTECAGVIICEIATGFVFVEYFDAEDALNERWAQVCKEVSEDSDDDNDTL